MLSDLSEVGVTLPGPTEEGYVNVLTATILGQGAPGDYAYTVEGELVRFGFVCARDAARAPEDLGGCGCSRGFAGMSSSRATTTALVRDLPLSRADVRAALEATLEREGWLGDDLSVQDRAEVVDEMEADVDLLLHVAGSFAEGTVLERRGDLVRPRALRTH